MPGVRASELSRRDADARRDAIIAREPDRLAELSSWVRTTGGPWDELDASIESLRPLWTWYLGFLADGCPGIPLGAVGLGWVVAEGEKAPPEGIISYGKEAIEHYVMLVCRRIDPSAIWTVERNPREVDFQRTGIQVCNSGWFCPSVRVATLVRRAIRQRASGEADTPDPNILRDMVAAWLRDLPLVTPERGRPALPAPRPTPNPPPVLWVPSQLASATGPPPVVAPTVDATRGAEDDVFTDLLASGDELLILRGPDSGLGNPSLLDPLDPDLVAAHLHEHGYTHIDTQDDHLRHLQFWEYEGDLVHVTAIVTSLDGSIRYVTAGFEGDLDPQAPGFRAAATTFITLAERLDARLTTSDELDEDLNLDG